MLDDHLRLSRCGSPTDPARDRRVRMPEGLLLTNTVAPASCKTRRPAPTCADGFFARLGEE